MRIPRLPAAFLALVLLAGCTESAAPAAGPTPTTELSDLLDVAGTVQGPGLRPIEGALVKVVGLAVNDTTDADGAFQLSDLPRALHLVSVEADGFLPGSFRVDPAAAPAPVVVVLEPAPDTLPFNETVQHRGILQCALEALIVSGSCDAVVTFLGQDPILDQNATWDFSVRPGWQTLVLDVVFDPGAQPGLDGLRVVVRALSDSASLGEYGQYGRFNGSASFTARLEPGATYPDGDAPLPANATSFRIDVYPHSHGWHTACDPTGTEGCFLGAGAGLDVAFDLFATAFYNGPAPEGFSLREA